MTIRRLLAAAALTLGAIGMARAQLPQMITPLLDQAQVKARGVATDPLPVRFNADALHKLRFGDDVELVLPNGMREVYVFDLSQDHGGGIRTWAGQHKDYGNRYRA